MIGIYKITNRINGHSYIGQSTNIEKRWQNEKIASNNPNDCSYDYPLSRAFRKYGIQNFSFEVIEECNREDLNDKEHYWICFYAPEYNQTHGGDYQAHGKLSLTQVQEIQTILVNDIDGLVLHTELAKKYNVSVDTIQAINAGRAWINSKLVYPLHLSKYDSRREKKKQYCQDCGIEVSKTSVRCLKCENERRRKENIKPVTREELKKKIRKQTFTSIGQEFGVSDNTIRKWCDKYNLPRKVSEIKKYSDEDWLNI